MGYLSLLRSRAVLGCFFISSLLLTAFPGIDTRISRLFFDGGFHLADQYWVKVSHGSVNYFVAGSIVLIVAIYVFNLLTKRVLFGVNGKKVVYLFLVLIVGAGLIVNVILKDNFGRARPRDIVEFGGSEQFTPAFVVSSACDRNCSFSSGDSAGRVLRPGIHRGIQQETRDRRGRNRVRRPGFGLKDCFWRAFLLGYGHFFFRDAARF